MTVKTYDVRWLQRALKLLGYYTGKIDGISGPKTQAGIVAFKRNSGLWARPYVGPLTLEALANSVDDARPKAYGPDTSPALPWITEISKYLGLHEVHDKAALSEWLRSDGATLGDPSEFPWCGDAAITALVKSLPDETLPDGLRKNPYWARNFTEFGQRCGHVYGAVAVFSRGSGGHVGFAVGYDPAGKRFKILGGNQGNEVSDDAWIKESRLLQLRWPLTFPAAHQRPLPHMDGSGAILSENEA